MIRLPVFLATCLLALAAHAQSTIWVAVADDGRSSFGVAAGMATREAAEISAVGECGGPPCRVKFAALARCVAYAHSRNAEASGYGAGSMRSEAEQAAMMECNSRAPSASCALKSARCFE